MILRPLVRKAEAMIVVEGSVGSESRVAETAVCTMERESVKHEVDYTHDIASHDRSERKDG